MIPFNATRESWNDAIFSFSSDEYNAGFRVRLMIDDGVRGTHALTSLNQELNKPFGKVPIPVRALAFALSQDGYPVEWRREDSPGDWRLGDPAWMPELCYRVLPKLEELELPSIDWSHVAQKYRWLAQCESGQAYLSEGMPSIRDSNDIGWSFPGSCAFAAYFSSFKPGKGEWRKLIVRRPAA